jgi:hypothetical protein
MWMIVFHGDDGASDADSALLRKAMSDEVVAGALFAALGLGSRVLVPSGWKVASAAARVEQYDSDIPVGSAAQRETFDDWFVMSSGRYFTDVEPLLVLQRLNGQASDVVPMDVNPRFESGSELARFASDGTIAGFRRFYDDGILPGRFLGHWPHHLAVKTSLLAKLAPGGTIPGDFGAFLSRCRANNLAIRSVQVGGSLLDLAREPDLAELLTRRMDRVCCPMKQHSAGGVKDARVVGNVVMGEDIVLSESALVVGPSVIGSRARIGNGAVVKGSVLGDNVAIRPRSVVQHRVLFECDYASGPASQASRGRSSPTRLLVSVSPILQVP